MCIQTPGVEGVVWREPVAFGLGVLKTEGMVDKVPIVFVFTVHLVHMPQMGNHITARTLV